MHIAVTLGSALAPASPSRLRLAVSAQRFALRSIDFCDSDPLSRLRGCDATQTGKG